MARIEGFRSHHVSIPIVPPRRTGNHVYSTLENVLVELDAEGLVGIGYAFNFAKRQAAAVHCLLVDLAETLVGKNVEDVRRHWQDLWMRLNFIGQAGPPVMALGAIDTALWDLFARQAGMPVWRLLGSVREEIKLYPTGGFLTDPVEAVIEELTGFKAAGYDRCKIKVGRPDWRTDVERVRRTRQALGDDFGIMVDANQAWSVGDAIDAGRALADLGVCWLEEPVLAHDVVGTAAVAQALDITVAAGESVFARYGHLPLIDARACDNLMLNLMRCGGPTEMLQIASMAAARHIPVSSHTFTEVSTQVIAAMPNATIAEYVPGWWDPLFNEAPRIEGGVLKLPDRPGFGLSFSRDVIRKYAN